jgi:hypothetical protein
MRFSHMTQHAHNGGMRASAPPFGAVFENAVKIGKRQE